MELRAAYHSLEERNRELSALVRKVNAVRIAASAGMVVAVVAIGAYLWNEPPARWFGAEARPVDAAAAGGREFTVKPARIASTISVPSAIRPRREIPVTSPVEGRVGTIHVTPGERVEAGQPLLELDVSEVQIQHRTAQAGLLRAKARMETFADWTNSVDVSRARRAVTRSRLAFEAGVTKLEEIAFLVERGLTPAARREAAEREAVRLGMSADMEIVVREVRNTLVVPVRAVDLSAGKRRVRVPDPATGGVRLVEVTTGITTIDSVEIVSGLAPGDTVIVP